MKSLKLLLLLGALAMRPCTAHAQSQELQQLILNVEKLNQLKAILKQLYDGYQILEKGYNTIKDLSQGNFSLHKTFLDALYEVSPTVKKYKKIVEIITLQQQILKTGKETLSRVHAANVFNPQETAYLENVIADLFERSAQNMEQLLLVITANQLRMNDAERLESIDRIYANLKDQLGFQRHFIQKTVLLFNQRQHAADETNRLKQLFLQDK